MNLKLEKLLTAGFAAARRTKEDGAESVAEGTKRREPGSIGRPDAPSAGRERGRRTPRAPFDRSLFGIPQILSEF